MTVRVQHGSSFWIFSAGASHWLTNHLTIASESGDLVSVNGPTVQATERNGSDGSFIRVESGSHYRQDCIVMGKCRGFARYPGADCMLVLWARRGAQ